MVAKLMQLTLFVWTPLRGSEKIVLNLIYKVLLIKGVVPECLEGLYTMDLFCSTLWIDFFG